MDLEEESNVRPPLLFTYNRRNKGKMSREIKDKNKIEGDIPGGPSRAVIFTGEVIAATAAVILTGEVTAATVILTGEVKR